MEDLRNQRDMRKAKRLAWLCVALAVLALVEVLVEVLVEAEMFPQMITLRFVVIHYLSALSLLFLAVFFCSCQGGYHSKQNILLLPICAFAIYELIYGGYYCFQHPSLRSISDTLCSLLEGAFLLILWVSLKKNSRQIRNSGKILIIGLILYGAFSVLTVWDAFSLIYLVCKLFVYALIVYRVMAAGDITLPGYPMREAKSATMGSAANISTTQGGVVNMGSKSKVAAALLAFFLGTTGAHRYYLGYGKQGAIQTCGFVSLVFGWMLYVPAHLNASAGIMLLSGLLLIYGGAVGIWAFIDFIRILTGGLAPADGSGYAVQQVQVVQPAPAPVSGADELEKLARLRDSGILTEEEFQRKKAEMLERM